MKINHISIWSKDLEKMKVFYVTYFGAKPNNLYENKEKGFSSYFLTFEDGARLELMSTRNVIHHADESNLYFGYCHMAVSVGTKFHVISLTNKLSDSGYRVISDPRVTGDGYFESVVLDPEGNRIEITI